jgi:hypothetical protein
LSKPWSPVASKLDGVKKRKNTESRSNTQKKIRHPSSTNCSALSSQETSLKLKERQEENKSRKLGPDKHHQATKRNPAIEKVRRGIAKGSLPVAKEKIRKINRRKRIPRKFPHLANDQSFHPSQSSCAVIEMA